MSDLATRDRCTGDGALRRRRAKRASSGKCAKPRSASPRARPAAAKPTKDGKTRRSHRNGSAPTCASSATCSPSSTTTRRCTDTSARDASTSASISTSRPPTAWPSGCNSSIAPPIWSCAHGGSISGEHGDGQARADLPRQDVRRRTGRRVPRVQGDLGSRQPDESRQGGRSAPPRSGPAHRSRTMPPQPVDTHFAFATTTARSPHATARCVGVGACRRERAAARCARATWSTREEEHSTRGRARLLFEMMEGEVLTDGWRNEHVREALDLCLACKGCKSECPVSVDMATYKAEFLSHYYEGRLRPRDRVRDGADLLVGAARRRRSHRSSISSRRRGRSRPSSRRSAGSRSSARFPRFASPTFRSWFNRRTASDRGRNATRASSGPTRSATICDPARGDRRGRGAASTPASQVEHSAAATLLRPPALRLGNARRGEATLAPDARHAARRHPRRRADRRTRAELCGGISR